MEKTLNIDGKAVPLRSSLYTHIAYKAQFCSDLLADLERANELYASFTEEQDRVKSAELMVAYNAIYFQILWVLVREASPDVPTYEEWLKSVGGMDIGEVVKAVTDLIVSTMKADRKNG